VARRLACAPVEQLSGAPLQREARQAAGGVSAKRGQVAGAGMKAGDNQHHKNRWYMAWHRALFMPGA